MTRVQLSFVWGIVLLAVARPVAAEMISTVPDDPGTYTGATMAAFGDPNVATFGQTFTIPSDNVLDSFSLYLTSFVNYSTPELSPVQFKGYVAEWDGTKITGPILYQSELKEFFGSPDFVPTEFSFLTGGLTLDSGTQYVAFLNAEADGNGSTTKMPVASFSDSYAGEGFVFFNNGSDFSLLSSNSWDSFGGEVDVWFKASFSPANTVAPVPEPASLLLMGIGAAGLGLVAKRRRTHLAQA